jgi:hypothetical protein
MRVIIIYVVLGSILVINPFLINKEIQLLGANNLHRLGMLLIVPVLSSYAIVVLYKKLTDKKQKAIAMVGIILLIAASGKFVYTRDNFYESSNSDKVYDLAVELSECVTKSIDEPTVIVSELQGVFIRQYDANIKLVLAPEQTENWQESENENTLILRALLAEPAPDMLEITNLTKEINCDYLILMEDQIKVASPADYGYKYIDTFEGFSVFENNLGEE